MMRPSTPRTGSRWTGLAVLFRVPIGLLAAAGLAGFAAPQPARAADAAPLVIAASRSPLAQLVHIAEMHGLFSAEGVGVRTVECTSGQRCLDLLFDKSAQLATASELSVVLNSFQRADHVIVTTIGRSTQGFKLVGRRSAGIAKPADLHGKRIGVQKGSISHYFLDSYLLFNGIDPQRLQMVGIDPTKTIGLAERQIDAVVISQDRVPGLLKALGSDAVVFEDAGIYTATVNLVADRQLLAERRGDVVRVLRALDRARQLIVDQPVQAKAAMRNRIGDAATLDWIVKSTDFRLGIEQSMLSTMAGEARWAVREGHVDKRAKPPNLLDYVETGPLRTALPSALP